MKKLSKKVKFEYYKIGARKKDDSNNSSSFNLEVWINHIANISLKGRTELYYGEKVRLDKCRYIENSKGNFWFLTFIRMRDSDIPNYAYDDKESEPITLQDDEYIGEEANCIYDVINNIIMVQRNVRSLSSGGISYYISNTLGDDNYIVDLEPIIKKDIMKNLMREDTSYKVLDVKFYNNAFQYSGIKKKSDVDSVIDYYESYKNCNAETTNIILSVGRRKDRLNREYVVNSIQDIVSNRDLIKSAKVTYENEDEPVHPMDILKCNMTDYIIFKLEKKTSLSSEYVSNEMIDKYLSRRSEIRSELM